MLVLLFVLFALLYIDETTAHTVRLVKPCFILQDTQSWAKYLSIVSLVLFIISFAIGPGSIPWFITAELFDQAARPYAISIATVVNWLCNFISGLVFPHMQVRYQYDTCQVRIWTPLQPYF